MSVDMRIYPVLSPLWGSDRLNDRFIGTEQSEPTESL